MPQATPTPPAPTSSPRLKRVSLTPDERGDVPFIRYRQRELARIGCGDPACPLDTCLVARQARVVMLALDALEAALSA